MNDGLFEIARERKLPANAICAAVERRFYSNRLRHEAWDYGIPVGELADLVV